MSSSSVAELTTERLEAELCQQAAHLDAALCRWLLVLAEFDKREAYHSWECATAAHFLNWRCGISLRTARDHLRVARALGELPVLTEAFSRGEISYSKARAITRVAKPGTDEMLVDLARHMTVDQLERVIRGVRFTQARDADALDLDEHVSIRQDYDGGLADLRGRLAPEDAALLSAALDRSRRDLASGLSPDGSREPPDNSDSVDSAVKPHRPTTVDALRAMCQTVLANGPKPAAGPDLTRVVLHVHADTCRGHLHDGPELALDTVRRLCCDSGGREVVVNGSLPIDLGRSTRQVSAKQRLFLLVRDGGCVFPGCTQRRWVDAHHIVHWLDGGPTDVTNLVMVCNRHHHAVHEGGYRVALATTGAIWFRPDGEPLNPSPHAVELLGPDIAEQNQAAGLTITPDTPVARWDGSNLELNWCVEGLLAREERTARVEPMEPPGAASVPEGT
jgi:hypothetical protein